MNGGIILFLIAMPLLVSCQANYIRDVQGGSGPIGFFYDKWD
jgi:hypothetical protein